MRDLSPEKWGRKVKVCMGKVCGVLAAGMRQRNLRGVVCSGLQEKGNTVRVEQVRMGRS